MRDETFRKFRFIDLSTLPVNTDDYFLLFVIVNKSRFCSVLFNIPINELKDIPRIVSKNFVSQKGPTADYGGGYYDPETRVGPINE